MNSFYFQIAEIVIGSLAGLGLLAGGIGYLKSQYVEGKTGEKKSDLETQNELTTYLKNQIETYKDIIKKQAEDNTENNKVQNEKFAKMNTDITTMKAVIDEKDKTIAKYLEILQNRNPDLEVSLKEISASMTDIKTFMKHIDSHLEKELKITGTVTSS